VELDQSKLNLKASLHGLEAAISKLVYELKALRQENSALKTENFSLQQKLTSSTAPNKTITVKEELGQLDMLDSLAVSSIDMSINELKNMVKNK